VGLVYLLGIWPWIHIKQAAATALDQRKAVFLCEVGCVVAATVITVDVFHSRSSPKNLTKPTTIAALAFSRTDHDKMHGIIIYNIAPTHVMAYFPAYDEPHPQ
jgi:hypothetical protein